MVSYQRGLDFVDRVIILPVTRSWWVFLFLLCTFMGYKVLAKTKMQQIDELKERIEQLEQKKNSALLEKEQYALRYESQEDPDYIEMVLKKQLGMVPKGERKVFFLENSSKPQ